MRVLPLALATSLLIAVSCKTSNLFQDSEVKAATGLCTHPEHANGWPLPHQKDGIITLVREKAAEICSQIQITEVIFPEDWKAQLQGQRHSLTLRIKFTKSGENGEVSPLFGYRRDEKSFISLFSDSFPYQEDELAALTKERFASEFPGQRVQSISFHEGIGKDTLSRYRGWLPFKATALDAGGNVRTIAAGCRPAHHASELVIDWDRNPT